MGGHHNHEVIRAAGSARKNKLANIATATIKLVCGLIARDPVLASEGGHDFGDAWVHNDHIKEIKSTDSGESRRIATRSAIKLGGFSLAGAGVELMIENNLDFSPNHWLAFSIASLSVSLNMYLRRDAHRHTIDGAYSLRSHTSWDFWVSAVTLGNATLALAGTSLNPAAPIGAHLALGCAAAWDIHSHSPEDSQTSQNHIDN